MFTFSWDELALDNVVAGLYEGINRTVPSPTSSSFSKVVSLLQSLFRTVGGLPISEFELDKDQLSQLAKYLLNDACSHVLASLRILDMTPGFFETDEILLPFASRVVAHNAVPINAASHEELVDLPAIGEQLASKIIQERQSRGLYSSLDDLAERIPGIGETAIRKIRNTVSLISPIDLIGVYASDFETRFRAVAAAANTHSVQTDPVIGALDLLCTICGNKPHPSSIQRRRRIIPKALSDGISVEWISPLIGEEYHHVISQLFEEATESIEVCMFHIALGGEDHPTGQLLQQLVSAAQRGVSVRVLLDRDRPTDIYNSSIINSRAKKFLEMNQVPVKFDLEDRLLHSKFIVADRKTIVIGSHNWSSGSFFEFDDVSLAIPSPILAQEYVIRFDNLWQA